MGRRLFEMVLVRRRNVNAETRASSGAFSSDAIWARTVAASAGAAHGDLVEQSDRGSPGHSVRAPQRQAYRIGRRRGRARGQIEQRRLRLPPERGVLVGESHRQNAGRGGGIEAAALPQDRAAHGKGLVGQGGAQSGGVGTLALTSIDGGRHLHPAPTHVGRRIVERGSQDFVFASPARAHHGQGLQGVAT
jgi:hypothetical protein